MKNKTAALLAVMGMLGGGLPPMERKFKKKCLLPSCDTLTSHNGGYCSAECCKKHRKELKSN